MSNDLSIVKNGITFVVGVDRHGDDTRFSAFYKKEDGRYSSVSGCLLPEEIRDFVAYVLYGHSYLWLEEGDDLYEVGGIPQLIEDHFQIRIEHE